MATATAKEVGLFGWGYNRAAFQFDAKQRWARFNSGRKFAVSQVDMFRQDVSDFAAVAIVKLKTYTPVMTMACGYCLTIFVEARSGLKFPAPPTFISGLYLQCLGIAFAFLTLGTWLVFHAALRAQAMAVQLRTRKVRVPVPTQRQLDSARQLLSNFEEQNPYDIFRLPFVMPQIGNTPEGYADVDGSEPAPTKAVEGSGKSKKASKGTKKGAQSSGASAQAGGLRAPRFTGGNPSWIGKEVEMRDEFPKDSPSGNGLEGPTEPFEHFELVRSVQQEYWGAEAYCRVCFLYGMMHLIQSFCYWLVIHCIAELAMVWCANVLAASLSAAVLLMFRLDVSPDKGGCFPIEAFGPFVAAIAMSLFYAHSYNQTTIDIGRAVAVGVLIMQILWTFRLYAVAKPSNNAPGKARENAGGRLFSASGNCDAPSWLPSAFQHVTYLIAPPKQKGVPERKDGEDPMEKVDMTPWYYTRALLIVVIVGWFILLSGRVVEVAMGERMLVSTPGHPPWTRTGQWDGWEHGPISSKHYAHVTPQKGHFAWQPGWGPQGQQELWASDMFGFAPEADMWWTENGVSGAPFHGPNTWYPKKLNYGRYAVIVSTVHGAHGDHGDSHGDSHGGSHSSGSSGSHGDSHGDDHNRRLQHVDFATRSLVPAAVQWPSFLEPELLACGPQSVKGSVAALTANGFGAVLAHEVAAGRSSGAATPFNIRGLLELGRLFSASWTEEGLLLVSTNGQLGSCSSPADDSNLECSPLPVPALPLAFAGQPVAATRVGSSIRAAIASPEIGVVTLWELATRSHSGFAWHQTAQVELPVDLVSIAFTAESLVVTGRDGTTHWMYLDDGVPVSDVMSEAPVPGIQRTWHASCMLPCRKVVRLASSWKRTVGGVEMLHPELLV